MCYHAQLGRFSLKSVVIDRGEHQKLRSAGPPPLLDGAVADPLKTSPLPNDITSNFVVLRQSTCMYA